MVSPTNWNAATITSPAQTYFSIVPSDSVNVTGGFRSLYIGTSGNVAVVDFNGNVATFVSVPIGILPVQGMRVNSTGTAASNILGLA